MIEGKKAFVGFTSATGNSFQITDLLTWSFCPSNNHSILNSIEDADISEKFDIILSPNPATDFITINHQPTEGFNPSVGSVVEIYDMLGVKVISEPIHPMTSSHRMNVEKLPAGLYFIKIGDRVEKFVKM